jgi:hypothetical protein
MIALLNQSVATHDHAVCWMEVLLAADLPRPTRGSIRMRSIVSLSLHIYVIRCECSEMIPDACMPRQRGPLKTPSGIRHFDRQQAMNGICRFSRLGHRQPEA